MPASRQDAQARDPRRLNPRCFARCASCYRATHATMRAANVSSIFRDDFALAKGDGGKAKKPASAEYMRTVLLKPRLMKAALELLRASAGASEATDARAARRVARDGQVAHVPRVGMRRPGDPLRGARGLRVARPLRPRHPLRACAHARDDGQRRDVAAKSEIGLSGPGAGSAKSKLAKIQKAGLVCSSKLPRR